MLKPGRVFTDFMQLGQVQPLSLCQFEQKWSIRDSAESAEWWYLGTDKYYHYLAER